MNTSPDLILAVPGTDQMEAVPRRAVREALQNGEIDPNRLVWSESDQAWMPLQSVPHLLTMTDTLTYTPSPEAVAVAANSSEVPIPVQATAVAAPVPKVLKAIVTPAPTTMAPVKTAQPKKMARNLTVKEGRGFPYLTLLAFVSFLALAGLVGANYYYVEMPFQTALKTNGLSDDIMAYANFGGFYQQDVVILHLIPGPALTKANLVKSLVTLAKSTPLPPGQTAPYKMIALTPDWLDSHYVIPSTDWAKFATMSGNEDQLKVLLIDHLQDTSGKPSLIGDAHSKDLDNPNFAMDEREQRMWDQFSSNFVPTN